MQFSIPYGLYSPTGSSAHGILHARIQEWVAISFSRVTSRPRDRTWAGAIFREALKAGAEEIIVAHNHPSGNLTPSKADITVTKELKDLAGRLNVNLIDHVILGESNSTSAYISLAELGLL